MAFVLGLGLMVTMMSFTNKSTKVDDVRLYRLGTSGTWLTEAQLQLLIGEDEEFVCATSDNYCSADFDEIATPTGTTPVGASNIDFGNGVIQEIE